MDDPTIPGTNIPQDIPAIDSTPSEEDISYDISFRLVLTSPDRVNELGRNAGLPLQAVSLWDGPANTLYLSWPPSQDYGYRRQELYRDLGKEVVENKLKLAIDKS